MPAATKETFFSKDHQAKTKKNGPDEAPFRTIAENEAAARELKTAKLRELRLQKEAEQPPEPAKTKSGRSTKKA